MTVFLGILAFFVILCVLVMAHELGHFTVAKLAGVRVEEFGLGFPPRIKGWRRGGTVYSLNALPLGGFVRMLGENGAQSEPDSFGAKPAWQRFLILVAGPAMNLLLAVAIFFFSFVHGAPTQLAVVTMVVPHTPAAAAGLRTGDRIVAVDGQRVPYGADLVEAVGKHLGERVDLQVQRGRQGVVISLVPRAHPPRHQGAMGIMLTKMGHVSYSPLQAATRSVDVLGTMVTAIPNLLAERFVSGSNSKVVGPIGIARVTTNVVSQGGGEGPSGLLTLMALLSANLGVVNLLPFPALDGGRIVFVLLSWVRRRNLDPQLEGAIHAIGMAVLLMLILLISYNDVVRWVTGASM